MRPGVVEYQDISGAWHTASRWPPSGDRARVYLSDGTLVADRGQVRSSAAAFQSTSVDPGYLCGPHQALYTSPPLAEDVLLAGNFSLDTSVTSTLPGGNLVAVLYHVPGDVMLRSRFPGQGSG